jgi:predicted ABC-type ATPase
MKIENFFNRALKITFTASVFIFVSTTSVCAKDRVLIPENVLTSLIADYTADEKERIELDLSNIRVLTFRGKMSHLEPIYIATAGAPGSGKSTILEKELKENPLYFKMNPAYIDPYQRGLKFMINTYWQDLTLGNVSNDQSYEKNLEAACKKWDAAANYIANTLLNEAFAHGYSIAHGTTSSGEFIEQLYISLKAAGYQIHLMICEASLENRIAALEHRMYVQGFYESTSANFGKNEQLWVSKIILYLKYANFITIWDANKILNFINPSISYNSLIWLLPLGIGGEDTCLSGIIPILS